MDVTVKQPPQTKAKQENAAPQHGGVQAMSGEKDNENTTQSQEQWDAFAQNLSRLTAHYQEFMRHALEQVDLQDNNKRWPMPWADQHHITDAFLQFYHQMLEDPAALYKQQTNWFQDYMTLLEHTTQRYLGQEVSPIIAADKKDRRFKDPVWNDNPGFDFIKQFYLLAARRMEEAVQHTHGLDPKAAQKVRFYTQQFIDALAPSNFLLTNPEALRATLETQGESLVKGMENLVSDITSGRISMTDVKAFEVGKSIACTPGKVVFRNELMELIQYSPATKTVHQTPLLMIPAWINKYYILDLRPENSLVKYLVDQGYTVFMISWVNPTEKHRDKGFDDYMQLGPLAAMDAIKTIAGESQVSAVGYCLGGTLLSITLAYLHAKGQQDRVRSATYYTTMTDFADAGELSVFIDDAQLDALEKRMSETGYLDGKEMALTFNILRSNDLIWHFVINNYLLGKTPFPFDLLYWNSDVTRMPAKMHAFYLRNMYQRNQLAKKGGITVAGVPIDLSTITTPTYMLSAREDHIAPWQSTYKSTQLFKGPVKFVLAASGHVAGVINPPVKHKYCFWTADGEHPEKAENWLDTAQEKDGSWWPDWVKWHKKFDGKDIEARQPGEGDVKALADAPGDYVKERV